MCIVFLLERRVSGAVIGMENLTMVSAALDSRPIDPDINRRIDVHGRVQRAHRVVCSFRKMGRCRGKQMERPISGVRCFSHLPLLFPCYFTKIIPLPRRMFNLNIIATVDIAVSDTSIFPTNILQ